MISAIEAKRESIKTKENLRSSMAFTMWIFTFERQVKEASQNGETYVITNIEDSTWIEDEVFESELSELIKETLIEHEYSLSQIKEKVFPFISVFRGTYKISWGHVLIK